MEYVRSRDSGDGGRVADTHNISKVQVKTASYTIKPFGESEGFIYSNLGAGGAVTFTLPRPKGGERVIFLKETAGQNIVINAAGAGVEIRGGVTPFTGTVITSSTANELGSIELLGGTGHWYVRGQSGTWTISG